MGALRRRCGVVSAGNWPGVALPLAAAPCRPALRSRVAVCPRRAARRSPTGTASRTGLVKASHGTSGRVRAAGTVVWRSATKQCDAGCPTRVAPQTRKGRRAGGLRTAALLPDAQQDRQSSARTRWCAPLAPRPVKGRVAHVRGVAVRRRVARGCGRRHRGSARIDRASSGAARMGALRQEEGEVRCKVAPHASAQRRGEQRKHGREGKGGNAHRTFGVRRGAGARLCGEGTGAIIAKTGVKDTDAATLCSVSQTLKQLARQAWREMEEAHKRQGRITAACSHATGSEAHLAAAQGANETQRLTLIATQLCARMATATDLTRRASNAAAKLSGHSAALAGEIDQWVSTMSSVVSKAQTGKFCLGSSSAATQGSSTLQDALATALKGKTNYDNGSQGKQQCHHHMRHAPQRDDQRRGRTKPGDSESKA
ncbi:hypothetical protein ERJ75_001097100 [Trypanosoma vivax]|nr:hypothetical protein ERJ75_001097100 [Trypanosoma vivax]